MKSLDAWVEYTARRFGLFAVGGMLAFTVITAVDIILRRWTALAIPGANEILALILPITIVACFPAGLAARGHLTITFLRSAVPLALRRFLDVLGHALLFAVLALLAWRVAGYAAALAARGAETTILRWPLAPAFWTVAMLLAISALVQGFVTVRQISMQHPVEGGAPSPLQRSAAILVVVATLAVLALALAVGVRLEGVRGLLPSGGSGLAIILFLLMWGLILITVPLGAAMIVAGLAGSGVAMGFDKALVGFGITSGDFLANISISILPLFLMMGSFAVVAGLSADVFRLAQTLFGHLRGGLGLATIGGCAGFGALTGLSVATVMTIGRVALPEMRARGYSIGLASGCVAAGGTLGILVPPSGAMILYGLLTEVSIGKMFIAALVPAVIATLFYMIVVSIYVRAVPDAAPPPIHAQSGDRWRALRQCWAAFSIFALVIGGIYSGLFTDEEAAAIGAGLAFILCIVRGQLRKDTFWQVVGETVQSTSMVFLLLIGGLTFSYFVSLTGLPANVSAWVTSLGLPPIGVIFVLIFIYLVLGAVMDAFAVMVITTPIFAPLVQGLGYDLVWWGIVMVMVIEAGLISPPFGVNVFVLKGLLPDVPTATVFRGVLPFFFADVLRIILIVLIPALVLWLPSTM